ncbi:MAG: family 16 glycosylhydrolase [Prevotella sp.]|jgi:beta-glucanase (GH16 family)|nr:family 16 glycosylhydrolase [Prevotella sp.]
MKNFLLALPLLLFIGFGCNVELNHVDDEKNPDGAKPTIKSPIDGYMWVWGDEFDGDEVDESKWTYRNWESWIGSTMCRPENVSISDGYMKITLTKEEYVDASSGKTYETTAGGLITRERFKFGYYEVSAKLSPVKGWHESFWGHWSNSNKTDSYFEGWQTAPKTEIDCFEHTADYDNTTYTFGMYQVEGEWPNFKNNSIHRDMHFGDVDLTTQFNTYGFEYAEEYINYFLNGNLIKTVDIRNIQHQKIHLWLTTIATKTPEGNSEVLWDYLRCFEPNEESDAYKNRKKYFLQVLKEMEGETSSEGIDLWVEAEDFVEKGGWTELRDENHMVLGGNSKKPEVEEDKFARTRIKVEKAGEYILWVRSKDFKNSLPGTRHFQVRVNGAVFPGFGKHASDNLYDWEKGGSVYLNEGENEIELYDSSCYYAKCDKMLFTSDKNFVPSGIGGDGNVEHVEKEQEKITFWIESEDFTNKGGWTVGSDAGNRVLMGQTKKPEDESLLIAKTTFSITKSGKYHLWVRSKDMVNDQPGRRKFEVSINGKSATQPFGTHGSTEPYDWQYGGEFTLSEGDCNIEMLDTSLFWVRCDKILLTTDKNFTPTGVGEETNVTHK